jgi:alkylhydroperoxidase family enzyme
MERLQKSLGNTVLVELVTVIAAYNMVSRFLIALDVHPEDHPPTV